MDFGYCPQLLNFTINALTIETLPDLNRKIESVENHKQVEKDWIYCPTRREESIFTGKVRALPYRSRIFGLPLTHKLVHVKSVDSEHLNFIIQLFGFLVGMRMSNTSAGFLDATPIKPGSLTDFYCTGKSLEKAVALSDEFWNRYSKDTRIAATLLGAIHATFIARNTLNLDFERFLYLCMAIDACFLVRRLQNNVKKHPPHSERIPYLCEELGIEVPTWAKPASANKSDIAIFRNETIHEALFFGKPLGFQVFGGNDPKARKAHTMTLLQMKALVCRFIIALLGATNVPYVKSPINTRSKWGLDI